MKTKCLAVGLALLAAATLAHGQGILTLRNTALSRVQLNDAKTGMLPVPTSVPLVYGVFVNGALDPGNLGTSSTTTAGIINAVDPYPITGYYGGETVSVQIRGWSAAFGRDWEAARAAGAIYGETDVRPVTLVSGGPGQIIWQSSTGISPNRFYPLVVSGGGVVVADITVGEGSNGVVNAVFTVTLPSPRDELVSVDFATQDGTALAGEDYVTTNGTLKFLPGETSRALSVVVTADPNPENDETFHLVLTNPVNAAIGKGTAAAVITEARISEIRIDTAIVFHTMAGRRYAVERSVDLANWSLVPGAEEVLGVGGSMTIHDQGSGCNGVRYYRTRLIAP